MDSEITERSDVDSGAIVVVSDRETAVSVGLTVVVVVDAAGSTISLEPETIKERILLARVRDRFQNDELWNKIVGKLTGASVDEADIRSIYDPNEVLPVVVSAVAEV